MKRNVWLGIDLDGRLFLIRRETRRRRMTKRPLGRASRARTLHATHRRLSRPVVEAFSEQNCAGLEHSPPVPRRSVRQSLRCPASNVRRPISASSTLTPRRASPSRLAVSVRTARRCLKRAMGNQRSGATSSQGESAVVRAPKPPRTGGGPVHKPLLPPSAAIQPTPASTRLMAARALVRPTRRRGEERGVNRPNGPLAGADPPPVRSGPSCGARIDQESSVLAQPPTLTGFTGDAAA